MRNRSVTLAVVGLLALGACTKKEVIAAAPPPPPAPPGSVVGSTAADRDGDGVVDGYYTADGVYHAYAAPIPPAPPPAPTRAGERG